MRPLIVAEGRVYCAPPYRDRLVRPVAGDFATAPRSARGRRLAIGVPPQIGREFAGFVGAGLRKREEAGPRDPPRLRLFR